MHRKEAFQKLVKDDNSKIIQINHLNKRLSSVNTKIDPHFLETIQQSEDPSSAYSRYMKEIQHEQLKNSLVQHQAMNKPLKSSTVSAHLNPYIFKHESNCRVSIERPLHTLNSVEMTLVNGKNDENFFTKENDMYQQYKKIEEKRASEVVKIQQQDKLFHKEQRTHQRKEELIKRLIFEQELQNERRKERENKISNQHKYRDELQKLIRMKEEVRKEHDYSHREKELRHNPITNPLPYHIDNPYFILKMQDRHKCL